MAIDPFTLISIGTSLSNTIGKFSSLQGVAQGQELNADLTQFESAGVFEQSETSVRQQTKSGERAIGSQLLAYAKAGVTFEGSPGEVFLESAKNIRHNIIITRLSANRRDSALRIEAIQRRLAASQARSKSIQAINSGVLDIGKTLLSSGVNSNTASKINQSQILGFDTRRFS